MLRARGHALAAADAEALVHLGEAVVDRDRALGADVRARAVAEAPVGAALVAARRHRGDAAVADAVVVADADRLRARAAALDERDATLGRRRLHAEDLRDLLRAGVAAGRAGAVGRGPRDESARVAVAAGEAAAAAVRAGERGGHEPDARVLLDAEVTVRHGERDGRDEPHAGDAHYCDGHMAVCPFRGV